MKINYKVISGIALLLIIPIQLFSQNIEQKKELNYMLNYLLETKYALYKSIEGISLEEWNYTPADGGWTIGEIAEHVLEAEKTIYNKLSNNFFVEENKVVSGGDSEETDKQILKLTTDRSRKLNAPEAIQPKGRWENPEDFLIYFEGIRNRTIDFVKNASGDFRLYAVYFPPLDKNMDGYDWLLIIPSHTTRHLAQIQENKDEYANGVTND